LEEPKNHQDYQDKPQYSLEILVFPNLSQLRGHCLAFFLGQMLLLIETSILKCSAPQELGKIRGKERV
jgi:hypothetical protein